MTQARTMIGERETSGDALRRASNAHARQVTTAGKRLDDQFDLDARLALDEDLRLSTRRATRPSSTWLEARLATGRTPTEVNFIGRRAMQGHVRSMSVVPGNEPGNLPMDGSAHQWYYRKQAQTVAFERADEALDDGNASLLADGAEPRPNTTPSA